MGGGVPERRAASDDQSAQLILKPVEAKLLAHSGAVSEARNIAVGIVRLADGTDGLNRLLPPGSAWLRFFGWGSASRSRSCDRGGDPALRTEGQPVGAAQARGLMEGEIPA